MVSELVVRARAGDERAFTELVRRYQDAVFATAYQVVYDYEAARDIAQETFVRAYEAIGSLRAPEAFPAWLVRTSRNLAVSWLRREAGDRSDLADVAAETPDPAAQVADRDLIARAFAALPEDNRLALSLWLVNGYTYDEVAELTDSPLSTVKGRIERGRRQIRREALSMIEETLKHEAPDDEFTMETLKACTKQAYTARFHGDHEEVISAASRILAHQDAVAGTGLEIQVYHAVGLLVDALYESDPTRWRETIRHLSSLGLSANHRRRAASLLYQRAFVHEPAADQDALREAALGLCAEEVRSLVAAQSWFFAACGALQEGDLDAAQERLAEFAGRIQAEAGVPEWMACLTAFQDLLATVPGPIPEERRMQYSAGAFSLSANGDALLGWGSVGWSLTRCTEYTALPAQFDPHDAFVPYAELPTTPGAEATVESASYSGTPTRTTIRVERAGPVTTPAGRFGDCIAIEMVTEGDSPAAGPGKPMGDNSSLIGTRQLVLARGVGPVEYRFERADGLMHHSVLAEFESPEASSEWYPMPVGARWIYEPKEPTEGQFAQVLHRVTGRSGDGRAWFSQARIEYLV